MGEDRERDPDTGSAMDPEPDPAIGRVVADADVLAADLLVDGAARAALDRIRSHSWLELVASDPLLTDAECVIAALTNEALAGDWREAVTALATVVSHPPQDHPALAAAVHGDARHVLSFDDRLRSAGAGMAIREHAETSVKHPDAFVRLADPAHLYAAVVGGDYPGPDRDPRERSDPSP